MSTHTTIEQVAGWLKVLTGHGGAVELRAFRDDGRPLSGLFPPGTDPRKIAVRALALDKMCKGVYVTLNPLRHDLSGPARDADVARRHWLLVDIDPKRPADTNATEAEKQAARIVADAIRAELRRRGWPEPIVADSGNGWHLLYRIDLPNDDAGKRLVSSVLKALAARFDTEGAEVDLKVANASRISKVYGTTPRKGEASDERPHRRAVVLDLPDAPEPVPVALLEALAAEGRDSPPARETPPEPKPRRRADRNGPASADPVAAYAREVLTREVEAVGATGPGGRNNRLNKAAFALGTLIGSGTLDRGAVEEALTDAARRAGLGDGEIASTLASGLDSGIQSPRDLSAVGAQARPHANGTARNGSVSGTGRGKAPRKGKATDADLADYPRTDLGNAERLVARYGRLLRYCHPWRKWLVWDSRRWKVDNTAAVARMANRTARNMHREAATVDDPDRRKALTRWAEASEKRDRLAAMMDLASKLRGVPVLPEDLDRDPWLLNVENGTIDLRAGELRPHRREDLITKVCPTAYDPDALAPLWDQTLNLFFGENKDLIEFWCRLAGYVLTGEIRDHVLPIAYGEGANGKSTILGALMDTLGPDYAMKAPPGFATMRKASAHPTEIADLAGKRLVVAIETSDGERLNESLIKELTGGDAIRARRMREDYWQFNPTHKLIIATNHRPDIAGRDGGIWRRVKLVPFDIKVEGAEADTAMPTKLRAERPGILAWMVRGCLEWQREGLGEPAEVIEATAAYRDEQDILGHFIAECCVAGDARYRVQSAHLYAAYQEWAKGGNEKVMSQTKFGLEMKKRPGTRKDDSGPRVFWEGIGLRSDREEGTI